MTARDPAWREGIQAVQGEAGGLLSLVVVQSGDVADLVGDALAGDALAMRLWRGVRDTMKRIQTAPRDKPMLCGSCPRALRKGAFAVVVATPACDAPTRAVSVCICTRCGTTRPEIEASAVIALKRLWPNSRAVTIAAQHAAGRA